MLLLFFRPHRYSASGIPGFGPLTAVSRSITFVAAADEEFTAPTAADPSFRFAAAVLETYIYDPN